MTDFEVNLEHTNVLPAKPNPRKKSASARFRNVIYKAKKQQEQSDEHQSKNHNIKKPVLMNFDENAHEGLSSDGELESVLILKKIVLHSGSKIDFFVF